MMNRRRVMAILCVLGCVSSPVFAKDKKESGKEAVVEAPPPMNQPGQLSPDSVVKLLVVGSYKSVLSIAAASGAG